MGLQAGSIANGRKEEAGAEGAEEKMQSTQSKASPQTSYSAPSASFTLRPLRTLLFLLKPATYWLPCGCHAPEMA